MRLDGYIIWVLHNLYILNIIWIRYKQVLTLHKQHRYWRKIHKFIISFSYHSHLKMVESEACSFLNAPIWIWFLSEVGSSLFQTGSVPLSIVVIHSRAEWLLYIFFRIYLCRVETQSRTLYICIHIVIIYGLKVHICWGIWRRHWESRRLWEPRGPAPTHC